MEIGEVVVGLFVAALAYLSYRGWVDVKWVEMEDASSTLTREALLIIMSKYQAEFRVHKSNPRLIVAYFQV